MAKIDQYLRAAVSVRASDVHFASGEPVRVRVDGDLVQLDFPPIDGRELQETLLEILSDTERQRFIAHKNLDKSYVFDNIGFFRVNLFWTRRGISGVLRAIPQRIPTPDELGLPRSLTTLADLSKGLVLVTGPTGSGKSTTLAALIGYINKFYKYHILTAEDPVEFVHQSNMSLINQREIGSSCPTFADALKYALREDPDVILVGEMRDLETMALALTAAETGHLVFGTLHTRGAAASIGRIIDSFPANQQPMIRTMLSESLVSVVSQALLKRADGRGRIAAYEIMMVNPAISNLIREGKAFQIPSIIQTARKEGMVLMDQYIVELVERGIVTPEEAEFYIEDFSILQARSKTAPVKPISDQVPVFQAFGKAAISGNAPTTRPAPMPQAAPAPAPKPQPIATQAPSPTTIAPQVQHAQPKPVAPEPVQEVEELTARPSAPPSPIPLPQKAAPPGPAKAAAHPIPPPPPPVTKVAPKSAFHAAPPPPKVAPAPAPEVKPQSVLTDLTEDSGAKAGEEFMQDLDGYSRIIEVGTVRDENGNLTGQKIENVTDPFAKKPTTEKTNSSRLPKPPPIPKKKAG